MKSLTVLLSAFFLFSCNQNRSSSTTTANADRWHFDKYLNSNATPKLAIAIFNGKWKLKDGNPQSFLDNLHGPNEESRPFYFRVITNSKKHADGEYSEGLSHEGYEYVKKYPGEFTHYFIGPEAFTDQDLKTWEDIVWGEFEIIGEDQTDKPLVREYLDDANANCRDCSFEQRQVLDKLGNDLKVRWMEYIHHVSN